MNTNKIYKEGWTKSVVKIFVVVILIILLGVACAPAPVEPPAEPSGVEQSEEPAAEEPPAQEMPTTNCETLLPAESCDPEWEARIQYVPLTDLPSYECTERLLDSDVGRCVVFAYTNNGQDFTITVDGADPAVVAEYINSSAVYFEVQKAGVLPPTDLELPSLATILAESAVEVTGFSQEELSAQQDSIVEARDVAGEATTLADVLFTLTGDETIPDQVLEVAIARAAAEYEERGVDSSLIYDELNTMMYEPGASVFVDPASLPQDNAQYRDILLNDPAGLAVTMEWVNVPNEALEEDAWVVWYAIDPILAEKRLIPEAQTSIGSYAYVYYKEKCNVYSAYVRIYATDGSMTVSLWRVYPYYYVGSRFASARYNPYPKELEHNSSPNKRTYDAKVRGGSQGGKYYIYGGWVQGSGCQ